MIDGEYDFTVERLFVAFGSVMVVLLLLFVFRVVRVFFFGKRYRGVISQVRVTTGSRTERYSSLLGRSRHYSYQVAYEDGLRGKRYAWEKQMTPGLQEYQRGDAVIIFVKEGEPPTCEILNGLRTFFSLGVILAVMMIMLACYLHLVKEGDLRMMGWEEVRRVWRFWE